MTEITAAAALAAADRAGRAIPPLFPLASSVAVNPFLGQSADSLAATAARLRKAGGIAVTMPRTWYVEKIASGEISDGDLQAAIAAAPAALRSVTVSALKEAVLTERTPPRATPTVADLAGEASGTDWPALMAERLGHWAAGWFDQGQALWPSPKGGAYAAWRLYATHDLTPEIAGLTGFAATVATAPEKAEDAIAAAVEQLGLTESALDNYFHRLLTIFGGWAQAGRYRLWQAELHGGVDSTLTDLVAILLTWEAALKRGYAAEIGERWLQSAAAFAEPVVASADDQIDELLQEAAERGAQRHLAALFAAPSLVAADETPRLQMAFCIDVRSELFRRALESLDPGIRTLGFAGFFGLGIAHRRFGSDVVEDRLPVLLTAGAVTHSGTPGAELEAKDLAARIAARAKRAWGRFRLAAVSSFAFVEAAGPLYIAKLVRDALGLVKHDAPSDPAPSFDPPMDAATRIATAEAALRAMSLTQGFARLVILTGHGANVVNNPHASALHCGACGGYSGEVNARLLASLLNDPEVRAGLASRNIVVPSSTLFLGALHDTTTDAITIYADDHPSQAHAEDLAQVRQWLRTAGALAATERAARLPRAKGAADIAERARNWAEVRPEWALAGCKAFVAAPRRRTAGKSLDGRAFLHDYDWRGDESFGVLELIITAPVVVASWISLQYYGSSVAPELFGAGNKLLHNVTGGLGVVEGNGGTMRAGLPLQSVSDGERLVHEPLRLSVLIEAPREAITIILDRHASVRDLFDNKWLHLFALDDEGRMAWRYAGNLQWEAVDAHAARAATELVTA